MGIHKVDILVDMGIYKVDILVDTVWKLLLFRTAQT
jgi:hypothetical protein